MWGKLYTGGCGIEGSACRPCKPPFPAAGYCQHHCLHARRPGKVYEEIHVKTWGIRGARGKPLGPQHLLQLAELPEEVSLCYPGSVKRKGSILRHLCMGLGGTACRWADLSLSGAYSGLWGGCSVSRGSCTPSVSPPMR